MPLLSENLGYMLAAAIDAIAVLGGYSSYELQQNREKQAALCYLIIVAGESANRVRESGQHQQYPQIQWHSLAGMRNRLAHQHHRVDFDIVIRTVTVSFPRLIASIEAILGDLP